MKFKNSTAHNTIPSTIEANIRIILKECVKDNNEFRWETFSFIIEFCLNWLDKPIQPTTKLFQIHFVVAKFTISTWANIHGILWRLYYYIVEQIKYQNKALIIALFKMGGGGSVLNFENSSFYFLSIPKTSIFRDSTWLFCSKLYVFIGSKILKSIQEFLLPATVHVL